MTDAKLPTLWTVGALARLVAQLRTVQKASGSGYKSTAAGAAAKPLEQEVDAAIAQIVKNHRL